MNTPQRKGLVKVTKDLKDNSGDNPTLFVPQNSFAYVLEYAEGYWITEVAKDGQVISIDETEGELVVTEDEMTAIISQAVDYASAYKKQVFYVNEGAIRYTHFVFLLNELLKAKKVLS